MSSLVLFLFIDLNHAGNLYTYLSDTFICGKLQLLHIGCGCGLSITLYYVTSSKSGCITTPPVIGYKEYHISSTVPLRWIHPNTLRVQGHSLRVPTQTDQVKIILELMTISSSGKTKGSWRNTEAVGPSVKPLSRGPTPA
jgi:hypothetical protein